MWKSPVCYIVACRRSAFRSSPDNAVFSGVIAPPGTFVIGTRRENINRKQASGATGWGGGEENLDQTATRNELQRAVVENSRETSRATLRSVVFTHRPSSTIFIHPFSVFLIHPLTHHLYYRAQSAGARTGERLSSGRGRFVDWFRTSQQPIFPRIERLRRLRKRYVGMVRTCCTRDNGTWVAVRIRRFPLISRNGCT